METTHTIKDEVYIQIVSPETLRRILDEYGEDYSKPEWMADDDEWEV